MIRYYHWSGQALIINLKAYFRKSRITQLAYCLSPYFYMTTQELTILLMPCLNFTANSFQ